MPNVNTPDSRGSLVAHPLRWEHTRCLPWVLTRQHTRGLKQSCPNIRAVGHVVVTATTVITEIATTAGIMTATVATAGTTAATATAIEDTPAATATTVITKIATTAGIMTATVATAGTTAATATAIEDTPAATATATAVTVKQRTPTSLQTFRTLLQTGGFQSRQPSLLCLLLLFNQLVRVTCGASRHTRTRTHTHARAHRSPFTFCSILFAITQQVRGFKTSKPSCALTTNAAAACFLTWRVRAKTSPWRCSQNALS